jgi:hypothetical protein
VLLSLGLVVLAMVAARLEGPSYQWRLWAVLFPPVFLAYVALRRLKRGTTRAA